MIEICGILIPKVFDKMWISNVLHDLKWKGIESNLCLEMEWEFEETDQLSLTFRGDKFSANYIHGVSNAIYAMAYAMPQKIRIL